MTFANLVDEVRTLPIEEKVELRHVLDEELGESVRKEILDAHREALDEYHAGKLRFTSDANELIRWLESE